MLLGDLLKDTPVVLKPETVGLLFSPQLEESSNPQQTLQNWDDIWSNYLPGRPGSLNHSLGGLLVMEDGPMPEGTLTWCGYTNPIWAANRKKGFAWFYATQVLPSGDVETGKLCQMFGSLVQAGKTSASSSS